MPAYLPLLTPAGLLSDFYHDSALTQDTSLIGPCLLVVPAPEMPGCMRSLLYGRCYMHGLCKTCKSVY